MKTRNQTAAFYRLLIFNARGSADCTNFMAANDQDAIEKSWNMYKIVPHKYGCTLYKYIELNTAGPFKRLQTLEEPKATE